MMYFDSHAHYWDDRFQEDLDTLLGGLFDSCVSHIINVGTSPETCQMAIQQASRYPRMYTALGIHPCD